MWTDTHKDVQLCIRTHTHTHPYVQTDTHTHTFTHTRVPQTHADMHIHKRTRAYIHLHTERHTHTQMHRHVGMPTCAGWHAHAEGAHTHTDVPLHRTHARRHTLTRRDTRIHECTHIQAHTLLAAPHLIVSATLWTVSTPHFIEVNAQERWEEDIRTFVQPAWCRSEIQNRRSVSKACIPKPQY